MAKIDWVGLESSACDGGCTGFALGVVHRGCNKGAMSEEVSQMTLGHYQLYIGGVHRGTWLQIPVIILTDASRLVL